MGKNRRHNRHRLVLDHRGNVCVPTCSCGWVGVPRPKHSAEAEYRGHRAAVDTDARIARRAQPRPAPLTPVDALPDELR